MALWTPLSFTSLLRIWMLIWLHMGCHLVLWFKTLWPISLLLQLPHLQLTTRTKMWIHQPRLVCSFVSFLTFDWFDFRLSGWDKWVSAQRHHDLHGSSPNGQHWWSWAQEHCSEEDAKNQDDKNWSHGYDHSCRIHWDIPRLTWSGHSLQPWCSRRPNFSHVVALPSVSKTFLSVTHMLTSNRKANAPSIQNDADFNTAKASLLGRDRSKTKINVEFEFIELEKFRISTPVSSFIPGQDLFEHVYLHSCLAHLVQLTPLQMSWLTERGYANMLYLVIYLFLTSYRSHKLISLTNSRCSKENLFLFWRSIGHAKNTRVSMESRVFAFAPQVVNTFGWTRSGWRPGQLLWSVLLLEIIILTKIVFRLPVRQQNTNHQIFLPSMVLMARWSVARNLVDAVDPTAWLNDYQHQQLMRTHSLVLSSRQFWGKSVGDRLI